MTPIHKALVVYILAAMNHWVPASHGRQSQYADVAEALVTGTDESPDDALQLAAIGSFESGYSTGAVGRLGEIGFLQIRPFYDGPLSCSPWSAHPNTKCSLVQQVRIGLYRWKNQGRCGYTGETNRADRTCPLADHRYLRAFDYAYRHPFVAPVEPPPALASAP
jgi:hypothetical protein